MTRRQWGLVIVMILINYIIFSQLFRRIMDTTPPVSVATFTPGPTFTPAPTETPLPVQPSPTFTPVSVQPTATNTPVVMSDEERQAMFATQTAQAQPTAEQPAPSDTPVPVPPAETRPIVTASDGNVNLRSGPGTNYDKVGVLQQGQSLDISGRNNDSSWWQVSTTDGFKWVADSVITASNVDGSIPVVEAPPPPVQPTPVPPTAVPPPAEPEKPQEQYTLSNMFGEVNEGITQVRGYIADSAGNPVNGARVRVRTGGFCTVSVPSGKEGVYPAGNYDILLDVRAKPVDWLVTIVEGPDNPDDFSCDGVRNVLSEEVVAPTNSLEGVVYVEWRKNW